MRKRVVGFTLIELLIVISIIIMLLVAILISIQGQIAKANDAKRKSDLYILKNAFEDYNNDNGIYPPEGSISNCGGSLGTYLKQIPCDPLHGAYGYFLSASTGGYRICAILQDTTDPAIAGVGCDGPSLCGLVGGYNYCLAQGTTASAVGSPDQTYSGGSVTPTIIPIGRYACAPRDIHGVSICNDYITPDNAARAGCVVTFTEKTCNNDQCATLSDYQLCKI